MNMISCDKCTKVVPGSYKYSGKFTALTLSIGVPHGSSLSHGLHICEECAVKMDLGKIRVSSNGLPPESPERQAVDALFDHIVELVVERMEEQ